jgi:PAS domain S-box-containing protein
MPLLDLLVAAAVTVAFTLVALGTQPRSERTYWSWAWVALVAAGMLVRTPEPGFAAAAAACLLTSSFAALQLAGAFEHVSRPVPRWLLPAALALGSVRFALESAGVGRFGHLTVVPCEVAALLGGAWLLYRVSDEAARTPVRWMLIAGFVLLAGVVLRDAWLDVRTVAHAVPWAAWLAVGIPTGSVELLAVLDRMQRQVAASLRERERALAALEQSVARFRAITESASDVIIETDADGWIDYVNPTFTLVLGHPAASMRGRNVAELIRRDGAPEGALRKPWQRFGSPGEVGLCELRHRDGTPRWLETTAGRYRGDGGAERVVIVGRDVSERRQADERVRRVQKLESLGLVAGGIAHDFNNLLTPILGNADLALHLLPAEHRAQPAIAAILEPAQRAAQLTRQLQAYAGGGPLETRALDLSSEIRGMLGLLRTAATERAQLQLELDEELPRVEADAGQLAQLLLNLVLNAAEACGPAGGTIRIRTGRTELSAPLPTPATGSLRPGPYVFCEVYDTGCGVDEAIREKLFDPFFTTKFTGRGLGLAVVHGVVTAHGGAMVVESEAGRGSCFRLLLPPSDGLARAPDAPAPAHAGRSALVLLVDDDPQVLRAARAMLEHCGHRVLVAQTGEQAQALLQRCRDEIELVLLDATMPAPGSEATLSRLRALRPDLPVLLMSGYAESEAMRRFAAGSLAGFLAKPFRAEQAAAAVRAALEGAGRRAPAALSTP